MKQARLKFQALLFDTNTNSIVQYITQPLTTEIINDITFDLHQRSDKIDYFAQLKQNIRIIRSSKLVGNVNGGDEIWLFAVVNGTSVLNQKDVLIEFNQRENNQVTWSRKIEVKKIYNNSIIIFDTPYYDKQTKDEEKLTLKIAGNSDGGRVDKTKIIEHPVKVFYRILIPSVKQYSPEWTFYYSKSKCTILDDLSESFVQKLNQFLSDKQQLEMDIPDEKTPMVCRNYNYN